MSMECNLSFTTTSFPKSALIGDSAQQSLVLKNGRLSSRMGPLPMTDWFLDSIVF